MQQNIMISKENANRGQTILTPQNQANNEWNDSPETITAYLQKNNHLGATFHYGLADPMNKHQNKL